MKYYKSVEDLQIEKQGFIYPPALRRWFILAMICVGFALVGCDTRKVDASAETSSKKENHMESLHTNATIQKSIPPIDAAASTRTETATFAMG